MKSSIKHKILCAGSLRTDDGVTPIGSLLVLDVDTREEAVAIINADPATQAGLRDKITVTRWNKASSAASSRGLTERPPASLINAAIAS